MKFHPPIFKMFLFFSSFIVSKEFFPKLLVDRYKPEFSDDQFDVFYPPYPESLNQLQDDCNKFGNESCLKLGIKLFYQVKNVSNPQNFEFLIPIFEKCARNGNGHCVDFLTQIEFFHSKKFDYHIPIAQNSFSKTVFGKLFRANLMFTGTGLEMSCIHALDEIAPISKASIIQFLSEPFHCLKSVDVFNTRLEQRRTTSERVQALEKYLITAKFPKELPTKYHCTLFYEKGRKLFLDFLESERSKLFVGKEVYQRVLSEEPRNASFYSDIVREIIKRNQTDFTKLFLSTIQLFMQVNGSRREDSMKALRALADDGDPIISSYFVIASILGMEPFDDEKYLKRYYGKSTDTTFERAILGISFEQNMSFMNGCTDSFIDLLYFINHSPIIYDCFRAQEAFEEGDYDLAILIYERLALMGNNEAAQNLGILMSLIGADMTPYQALYALFDYIEVPVRKSKVDRKLFVCDYIKSREKHPFSAIMYALLADDLEVARNYLYDFSERYKWAYAITVPVTFILEPLKSIRILLSKAVGSGRLYVTIIAGIGCVYFFVKSISSCM